MQYLHFIPHLPNEQTEVLGEVTLLEEVACGFNNLRI